MEKHPSIKEQMMHLKNEKKIHIRNDEKVINFLKCVPYEMSIKEIKPLLAVYNQENKTYQSVSWKKVEKLYKKCKKISIKEFERILNIENNLKAILIYKLQRDDYYKEHFNKTPKHFNDNKSFFIKKYNQDEASIHSYMVENKFYTLINMMGFKSIIDYVFTDLFKENKLLYDEIVEELLDNNIDLNKISFEYKINLKDHRLLEKETTENKTITSAIAKSQDLYFKSLFALEMEKYNNLNEDLKKLAIEYYMQIDNEPKFTNYSGFHEFVRNLNEENDCKFSNSKIGDILYNTEFEFKSIIMNIKDIRKRYSLVEVTSYIGEVEQEQKQLLCDEIEKISKVILIYIMMHASNESMMKKIVDITSPENPLFDEQLIIDTKNSLDEEYRNKNLKKYLLILADIRNSIAHGGTFIIPLFTDYDDKLREIYIHDNIPPNLANKILDAKLYFRSRKDSRTVSHK